MTLTSRSFALYLLALFAGAVLALVPVGPVFAQVLEVKIPVAEPLRERLQESILEDLSGTRANDEKEEDSRENRGRGNEGIPPGWERRLPAIQIDPEPVPVPIPVVREPRERETPQPPIASSTPEEPEGEDPVEESEDEAPAVATTTSTSTGGAYTTPGSTGGGGALAIIGETLFPSQGQVYQSNQISPQASLALLALAALLGTGGLALLVPGLRMRNLVPYTRDSLHLAPRPAIRY